MVDPHRHSEWPPAASAESVLPSATLRELDGERGAVFSPCRRYRYALWRRWGEPADGAVVVGLNPSTADEHADDPTVRRCIAFARDWGFSGLTMINLFAFRATRPADLVEAADPVGPDNDRWLQACCAGSRLVVAAWGRRGGWLERDQAVRRMLPPLQVLGLGKTASPLHPLYLPRTRRPVPWT
ncbi:DUF1643 domain-containing protein [Synechococcus sp. CS-1327]|nr:DUF1643 domain-containing protein [Synechococcus sp. CS-1326]MCT0232730.1 DUF1643 domain-containing protein [Synechococcus sp. CS-1327]